MFRLNNFHSVINVLDFTYSPKKLSFYNGFNFTISRLMHFSMSDFNIFFNQYQSLKCTFLSLISKF